MTGTIGDRASLDAALDRLVALDADMAPVRAETGVVPLRAAPADFASLARIVTGQQVSKAAASAIVARVSARLGGLDAARIHAAGPAALRACGLSRAKTQALTALAAGELEGRLDLAALARRPAQEALAALTAHRGVGPWTAQSFLLFCGGHPDIFPAGDVALQHATGWVSGAAAKPDARMTGRIAERWRGERSAAARLLYAFYAVRRGHAPQGGATPV